MVKARVEELLQESIEEGMTEVIGESATKAIFYHIRRSSKFGKARLAEKPEEFAKELEAIFGAGALIIERIIIQKLYQKIGLGYTSQSEIGFLEAIKQAEKRCPLQLISGEV